MFRKKKKSILQKVQETNPGLSSYSQMIAKAWQEKERFGGWDGEELDTLDQKFDALCEYLKVEFISEKISDGSEVADKESFYCRKKK